jgi:tetratricopeptide (TPR) repeat protein
MRLVMERHGWLRELSEFALDGDVNSEIAEQQRIIQSNPSWAKAHLDLGILLYSQGRVYEAIGEFLMAIECDSTLGLAHRRLGEVYVGLGDYREAGKYAIVASEYGDSTLLEAFNRYPGLRHFVERPEVKKPGHEQAGGDEESTREIRDFVRRPAGRTVGPMEAQELQG